MPNRIFKLTNYANDTKIWCPMKSERDCLCFAE